MSVTGMPSLSWKDYQKYQQGQQKANKIAVTSAKRDLAETKKTPQSILDYKALLSAMPSSAFIGQAYDNSLTGMGTELANLRTGKAAQDVSSLTQAIGAGLGVNSGVAQDLATQAGTISSNDAALLSSAAADFGRAKLEDMKAMIGQRMDVTGKVAGAEDVFAQNKTSARDRLAQMRMQGITSRPDPVTSMNAFLTLMSNLKTYNKSGSGNGSGKTTTTVTTPTGSASPALSAGLTKNDLMRMFNSSSQM
jgi:hypothetical protein